MYFKVRFSLIICGFLLATAPFLLYAQADDESSGQPKGFLEGLADSAQQGSIHIAEESANAAEQTAAVGSEVLAQGIAREASFGAMLIKQGLLIRLGIAAAIVIIQFILLRVIWNLFTKLNKLVMVKGKKRIKPLTFKQYKLLGTQQIMTTILFLLKILKYLVTLLQFYLTLPLVFSLFEPTKDLAFTLFGYILTPIKNALIGIVSYIPKLITIVVIMIIVRYALRSIKFFADQIEKERLVIPGFFPDWAQPTFNILRVLLYAFAIIVIYPYLPGSESAVFQGVSMFVGLIFSLGSSSAIGNLVAGVVLTYMRPFKVGDRIKIGDITGFVVEKSTTITRIRTHKNEFVSLPNQSLLNATIINYNYSAEESDGVILHTDVTMTYAVHWTIMYNILLTAAKKTVCVLEKPEPFILQQPPEDNYARYELNIYVKEVDKIPAIFSDLHNHLQDEFRAAGIDMTAPFFHISTTASEQLAPVELKFPYFPTLPPPFNALNNAVTHTSPDAPSKARHVKRN